MRRAEKRGLGALRRGARFRLSPLVVQHLTYVRNRPTGSKERNYRTQHSDLLEVGCSLCEREATPGFEPGMRELQSLALPLGHVAEPSPALAADGK